MGFFCIFKSLRRKVEWCFRWETVDLWLEMCKPLLVTSLNEVVPVKQLIGHAQDYDCLLLG